MIGRSASLVLALSYLYLWLAPTVSADTPDLSYYLPTAESQVPTHYDPAVPKPADVFGFQPGEWHVRHDQLVEYMEELAAASERVTLRNTGRTHEGRRLVVLTITSPENHSRLDEIQQEHLAWSDPASDADLDLSGLPAVAYLGYGVHGNEASASNAAPLVAYYLAAGRSTELDSILDDVVVLLDPSLNPDGQSRFAHWVNTNRGVVLTADPHHREHNEPWPGGRTNHYFFDLNRDWLLAQHPETRARLTTFHAWRPNVHTDHHEMGTHATFFFQPGVDSRKNPLTPERNVELTQALAEHHAAALDQIGSLYYTRESFDDFYYGKGSTYPDIQGAVGILFEQASARGHVQESDNAPADGVLTFPFGIRNQVVTSLSTLRGTVAERENLLSYQRDFYRDAAAEATAEDLVGWVVSDAGDAGRLRHMADVLTSHGIETRALKSATRVGGRDFEPGDSLVVPLRQRQSRLARALFETRTEFEDDTFYDVSSWTLPHAFGLPFAELTSAGAVGESWSSSVPATGFEPNGDAVAYAVEWHHYAAPSALNRLQRAGVRVRAAGIGLEAETPQGGRHFEPGTLLVHLGFQDLDDDAVNTALGRVATEDGIEPIAILGGLTVVGPDLGSPNVRPLSAPKVAIVSGSGFSSYEVGAAWHLLDHRFGVETTLLDRDDVEWVDLDRYSHLVLVNGRGLGSSDDLTEKIRSWARGGGVLVAIKGGARWATERVLKSGEEEEKAGGSKDENDKSERKPYADFDQDFAKGLISGTIFQSRLDLTHPLAFGYREELLSVFKNSRLMLEAEDSPYITVAAFTDEPLLSGYVSEENAEKLAGTPAVIAQRFGRGAVVRFAIDPNFRAIWYGTNRLFLNSIFLSGMLDRRPAQEPREEMHGH
ncbi:MAG: M14 family metallopeptidase [Thermoanaerobaculia bacterium]|nr:M14 family metallopeptidase [Thermoanaerobaculia bacterium]